MATDNPNDAWSHSPDRVIRPTSVVCPRPSVTFALKVQIQSLLCQMKIEGNTRK